MFNAEKERTDRELKQRIAKIEHEERMAEMQKMSEKL